MAGYSKYYAAAGARAAEVAMAIGSPSEYVGKQLPTWVTGRIGSLLPPELANKLQGGLHTITEYKVRDRDLWVFAESEWPKLTGIMVKTADGRTLAIFRGQMPSDAINDPKRFAFWVVTLAKIQNVQAIYPIYPQSSLSPDVRVAATIQELQQLVSQIPQPEPSQPTSEPTFSSTKWAPLVILGGLAVLTLGRSRKAPRT